MDMEEKLDHLARVMERGFDTLAELQRETNQRLDRHEDILGKLADGMLTLSGEMKGLNGRFDNLLTGMHREDHDALRRRVERLERHVGLTSSD